MFLAQCLEFNIVVQGNTHQEAQTAFMEHLVQTFALVHQHGARDPFDYLGSGPPDAWRAWDAAFKGIPAPAPIPFDGELRVEPALACA